MPPSSPSAILLLLLAVSWPEGTLCQSGVPALGSEYIDVNKDGSYKYGFQTGDAGAHYQAAVANQKNQVAGRFGSWDPAQRRIVDTEYTSGRRGFRARGPNIARKMDLSQAKIPYNPPVSPNSPNYKPTYDGYHDPNEDPSYSFMFRSPTYSKQEVADPSGRVNGAYYYYDDIGERHDVTYEAGAKTGFNVNTPFPDSKVFNGLFYKGPAKGGGKPRGKSSIQQRLDGSYRFVSSGPDQRRTEVSDSSRNVRGSYTYVDDKGQQRTVEYIAGPNIGYRIVKKGIGPSFPAPPPFIPPPNFTDLPDVIHSTPAPSGSGGRPPFSGGGLKPSRPTDSSEVGDGYNSGESPFGGSSSRPGGGSAGSRPPFGSDSSFPGGSGGSRPPFASDSSYPGGSGGSRPPFGSDSSYPGGGGSYGSGERPGNGGGFGGSGGPGGDDSSGESYGQPSGGSSGERPHSGEDNGFPPGSGDSSGPGGGIGSWAPKPTSTKPPIFTNDLFKPGKFPPPHPTPPSILTSSTTDVVSGYYDHNKPSSQPFPFPNNCCGNGPTSSTVRPDSPASAFPEDDPSNGSQRPPRPGESSDDFLLTPFADLPGKDYPSYRPPPNASSRPSGGGGSGGYFYNKPGDNTFLSSNKNYFSFPHGVAVRAHIQSLDILPFGSRIPPPGLALEQGISNSG